MSKGVSESPQLIACDQVCATGYPCVCAWWGVWLPLCVISVNTRVCDCGRMEPFGGVQIWALLVLICGTVVKLLEIGSNNSVSLTGYSEA